ncbi:spore protease YyaC [Clostridium sp. YIM B02551]|nr:spore protease YyaC [Clostridium sp. YIM B02551]
MNKVKVSYKDPMSYYELAYFLKDYINNETIIICIGTDKCIGDCLGPMVGTLLIDTLLPIPVYGTLNSPIHALNIDDKLQEIYLKHPNALIIGIDACLGDTDSVGEIHVRDYPIHPGKGVGKKLPKVGDVSIIGIVDTSNNSEIFSNRAIRLSLIFEMCKVIVKGIVHSYYLSSSTK